jgi:2-C-methyl-D-erythritol 4-phosphate cytidylyltransferase
VANALADSEVSGQSWVLVHDAARPGLPLSALQRLIDACLDDAVGGLLAMPVLDTVKLAMSIPDTLQTDGPRVLCTEERQQRWLAQTPQMFPADKLRHALHEAARRGLAITDEAQALEAMGHAPLLVRGHSRNFKVTWPEDFKLMEKWL